ncbi:MAG: DNA-processing protein DprA [Acidimicrobiia bacterium]
MGYNDEHAYLVALLRSNKGVAWHRVANVVDAAGTAEGLVRREVDSGSDFGRELVSRVGSDDVKSARAEVESWAEVPGMAAWSILDADYPAQLRRIFDRPPLLFCLGRWEPTNEEGFCVVGTRQASPSGLDQARLMAASLTERGIAVTSGLALGVDTTAHTAALDAGGRTVAVLGNGLASVYPPENKGLADRIIREGGALVSPFVPAQGPNAKFTFQIRNSVMSGLSRGTIVIEAGPTSGAKMQARLALRHGRPVFLMRSLVDTHDWALDYVTKGRHGTRAITVEDVDDVLEAIDASRPIEVEQLALGLDG